MLSSCAKVSQTSSANVRKSIRTKYLDLRGSWLARFLTWRWTDATSSTFWPRTQYTKSTASMSQLHNPPSSSSYREPPWTWESSTLFNSSELPWTLMLMMALKSYTPIIAYSALNWITWSRIGSLVWTHLPPDKLKRTISSSQRQTSTAFNTSSSSWTVRNTRSSKLK